MIMIYKYPIADVPDPIWGLSCSITRLYIPVTDIETGQRALAPRHHVVSYISSKTMIGEEVLGSRIQYFAQCRICGEPYAFKDAKVVHDTEEPPGERWKAICHNCLNKVSEAVKAL